MNGTMNHVHLLVSFGKKVDVPELVGDVKRSSSSWIKKQSAEFNNFYWQRGYGAFSVGQTEIDMVIKYIQNQKKHHEKKDFKTEFRGFLDRYGIDYDERYVWD